MAAIYSSCRDVSGILTPGVALLVLLAAPVSAIFLASGATLLAASAMAANQYSRLGAARPSHGLPLGDEPLFSPAASVRSPALGSPPPPRRC